MAQLLPTSFTDPVEDVESDDLAVSYGESWVWVHGDCSCGKDYPHLEVVGQRAVRTHGLNTLVQWLRFAVSIERYRYPIYSTDFGVEFDALISRSPTQAEAETEMVRMVREALSVDPRVDSVRYIRLNPVANHQSNVLIDIEILTFSADVQRVSLLANLEV